MPKPAGPWAHSPSPVAEPTANETLEQDNSMKTLSYNRFGFVAFSLASVYLTSATNAAAQDPMDPTVAPPPDATASASVDVGATTSADATAAAPTPEPAPAPAPPEPAPAAEAAPVAEAQGDAKLEGDAAAVPAAAPATTTVTGTSPEREAAVALIGLEQLPGSAYPEVQTRGIKYGSLWRTFHGQQWPYLPQIGDKPQLRIGFSGYVWNDLSNAHISVDPQHAGSALNSQNRWTTQTRGIVRVTPTYNAGDDWFVQGNAEAVIQGDMQPDPASKVLATTDDVWIRAGKWNVFDVTVGRFQGWEIANHFGMALDWATLERQGAWIVTSSIPKPTDGYGLNYFWDRQNFALGTYAAHVYPTKYLRGELLGHIGAGNSSNANNPYQYDIRPSAIFDIGILKVKAGWEYGKAAPQDKTFKVGETKNGFGVAAQVVLAPYVEFGGSFARGFVDVLDQFGNASLSASNTGQSFGGFLNVSPAHEPLVFGFGAFWNHQENMRIDAAEGPHKGKVDTNDQQLMFGAVQYTIWERLYLKFVLAHANNIVADYNALGGKEYTNTSTSGRLRIEFLY